MYTYDMYTYMHECWPRHRPAAVDARHCNLRNPTMNMNAQCMHVFQGASKSTVVDAFEHCLRLLAELKTSLKFKRTARGAPKAVIEVSPPLLFLTGNHQPPMESSTVISNLDHPSTHVCALCTRTHMRGATCTITRWHDFRFRRGAG